MAKKTKQKRFMRCLHCDEGAPLYDFWTLTLHLNSESNSNSIQFNFSSFTKIYLFFFFFFSRILSSSARILDVFLRLRRIPTLIQRYQIKMVNLQRMLNQKE